MNILLLPGFMLDADLWNDVAAALGERYSLSYGDLSRDDSIKGMADTVLASAPPVFVLVGFSMGGYVAREIARKAPGRVHALILVATSGRADTVDEAARKLRSVERVERQGFTGLSTSSVRASLHEAHRDERRLVERILAMAKRLGGDAFVRQATPRNSDLHRLWQIACPTLIIASAGDRVRNLQEAEELQAGIPGAKLLVVDGAGHMLPLEAPDRLASIVDDWIRNEASSPILAADSQPWTPT